MNIHFFNSLTGKKELFKPNDSDKVNMYACGPTVYDRAHIGNARSAVTYDVIYRFLKSIYPQVNYVRNITDIDDKIINACIEQQVSASSLTAQMTDYYRHDMQLLNCLTPTIEPKATEYISHMIKMIESLISKSAAYVAQNHVLFSVDSFNDYGQLSNRSLDEMIAGARIEVAPYKKNPADFVLWKPAVDYERDFGFDSPWGIGRPGWHIECSAMINATIGKNIDIHGGGIDLIFPHHENEIAQSKCALDDCKFANYWIHNGFLMVNGQKMSKSLNNFTTVKQVFDKGIEGCVMRYFYLTVHYRKPIDFNDKAISDAKKSIAKFRNALNNYSFNKQLEVDDKLNTILADDLNTPLYLSQLHEYANEALRTKDISAQHKLAHGCKFIGIDLKPKSDFKIPEEIIQLAEQRLSARIAKEWQLSDELRNEIYNAGYVISDNELGYQLAKKIN